MRTLGRTTHRIIVGLLTVAVLAGCASSPDSGSVDRWVAANAVPLRSVAPLAAGDDLAPVARSVGHAQIVGLGEATHGVAETLQLKQRLLQALVEQRGFRSIAWEEDWTVGEQIDAYLRTGAGDISSIMAQMSPQWQTRQVADVLAWLRGFNIGRPDPVRFVGVEYYLTRGSAYDAVEAYVARVAPGRLAELRADLAAIRPTSTDIFSFVRQVMAAPDKSARLARARRVRALVAGLPAPPPGAERDLAVHAAEQIVAFYQHYSKPDADALIYRDERAAENVRWWRDRTHTKIVYWAAAAHTANAPTLRIGGPPGPELRFPAAGSYLRAWYGGQYRSVLVTLGSGAGSVGPGQTVSLAAPAPDRFERPLLDDGPALFALDLQAPAPRAVRTWLDAPARFRGLAERGPGGFLDGGSPAQWFDLVVFHRGATPADPAG
jgi:erythromycin esterase